MCCSVLQQSGLKEQKIVLKMNVTACYWLTGSALQKKHAELDHAPKRNEGKEPTLSKQGQTESKMK